MHVYLKVRNFYVCMMMFKIIVVVALLYGNSRESSYIVGAHNEAHQYD